MQFDPKSFSDRCDHILSDIEAGHGVGAIATLGGLLDAAACEPESANACRLILCQHPLYEIVRSPSMAQNVAMLGFSRAETARRQLTNRLIQTLSDTDQSALLVDCAVAFDEARNPGCKLGFAHILAPAIADAYDDAELLLITSALAARLRPGGRLCLSAFAPNHLGHGWQTICLARQLHCHDEASFAQLATEIGATHACFRDASGGLVWADFKLADHARQGAAS